MDKIKARVMKQDMIGTDIYSLEIRAAFIAESAKPGQFVALYSKDGAKILPRPISICEIHSDEGTIRLVYRIAGEGTREFSKLKVGDHIEVMGPLGNGFRMENNKKAILIGGGIGIPPMLELAKQLDCDKSVVLGYRDEIFMAEDFESRADVYMASEDGKHGVKGNVINAIEEYDIQGDIIYACGPTPMLKAIKEYAEKKGIKAQISMEERMACGIGACLACVCKSKDIDEHSNSHTKRVCKDGPVFDAREVDL